MNAALVTNVRTESGRSRFRVVAVAAACPARTGSRLSLPHGCGSDVGACQGLLRPGGTRATGGFDAELADLERITDAILAGKITVPIAATVPLERIRDAVTLQAGRHVHGKIVVTL
jgi:NADPH:quinone reductase-like Zn-dependent oxidoreductase